MPTRTSVIVTTTQSKSAHETRFVQALKTCKAARELGYKLIVVDGSPDHATAKDLLLAKGATTVLKQVGRGMGKSRRQAIMAGLESGADAIAWLEPEKYPLVPLLRESMEAVLYENVDILVPGRKSFSGYPQYQQFTELSANWEMAQITGMFDLDLIFGPRILKHRAAALFCEYDGEHGDDWQGLYVPVLRAIAKRLRVSAEFVEYKHPREQYLAEEGDRRIELKRDKQRNDIVKAMLAEAARLDYKWVKF